MECTLVLIKPDAVERGLIGTVIQRLEQKGFKLDSIHHGLLRKEDVENLYKEHRDKPFFKGNNEFILSGPCVAMVWFGPNVIDSIRTLVGNQRIPGTIRGDFACDIRENMIHASDSVEAAKREIQIFFPEFDTKRW